MQQTRLKSLTSEELDQLAINTIRTLSIDAVQQAKSGHPGTPMALAPLVYVIWNEVMRFDPQDPIWPNRAGQTFQLCLLHRRFVPFSRRVSLPASRHARRTRNAWPRAVCPRNPLRRAN